MTEDTESVRAHYDAIADDYHERYQRENLGRVEKYPANYFRLQILASRIGDLGARSVYEVGVGEGTPLARLAQMGIDVAGCDISNEMVASARTRFEEHGLDPELIQWGDIEDSVTVTQGLRRGPYDAVIAAGVLPHVAKPNVFLENVRMLLRSGGTCFIEFRNKLFSLFTLNRYSREFFLDDLLAGVDPKLRGVVAEELDQRLAVDQPPERVTEGDGAPGYDAIRSNFHNPFELVPQFDRAGFRDARIHWYHFHPVPPMLEDAAGDRVREAAFALEHDPSDWRGYFLCSAGVIEAVKA